MTSLNIEILNLAVAGHVVLTERVDHTVIADGKTVHTRAVGAFDIAGDKITAWRDYFEMSHAES